MKRFLVINHNKYYYLIIGTILHVLDKIYLFVWYDCRIFNLLFRMFNRDISLHGYGFSFMGHTQFDYLVTYMRYSEFKNNIFK